MYSTINHIGLLQNSRGIIKKKNYCINSEEYRLFWTLVRFLCIGTECRLLDTESPWYSVFFSSTNFGGDAALKTGLCEKRIECDPSQDPNLIRRAPQRTRCLHAGMEEEEGGAGAEAAGERRAARGPWPGWRTCGGASGGVVGGLSVPTLSLEIRVLARLLAATLSSSSSPRL